MDEQKKTAVGIRCEISQEYQDQLGILRNMEGVQAVTVWEESTQRLEWNGYEAEITLTGTDQEYLQTHFPICARRFIVSDCRNQWGKSKGIWNQHPGRKTRRTSGFCICGYRKI